MARLLAYTAPASGHVYPSTALLLELHRRGHEVHVRTRASDVECLGRLGLHAGPLDPRIEANELDDWKAPNPIAALQRLQRWYEANATVEVRDLRGAIEQVRPDALIVDTNCQGGAAVAEASGLPWCQYSPFPPVFSSKDAPPYGPGLQAGPGPVRARATAPSPRPSSGWPITTCPPSTPCAPAWLSARCGTLRNCSSDRSGSSCSQKALAAGVPVCVVPFCRDQFEVARRVEVSQAGTKLHHKRLTATRLREAVHTTIRMRKGAQRVAQAFARSGGAPAAADAVEQLLGGDQTTLPSSRPSAVTTAGIAGNL